MMKITDMMSAKQLQSGLSQVKGEMTEFLTTIVTMPFVTKQYSRDGRPVIDCFDPTTGEIMRAVPVVSLSAGGEGGFRAGDSDAIYSNINDLRKSAQAYIVRNGKRKEPICIGFIFKEKRKVRRKRRARRQSPAAPTPPATGNDVQCPVIEDIDTTKGSFPGDSYIRQGNAKVVITSDGTIVLDNKESNQPDGLKTVNVQLAETGSLRISRVPSGGQPEDAEAKERILLAKATRKFIDGRDPYTGGYEGNTLGAYVASLEARIEALEAALNKWVPVPPDGGAALKTLWTAEYTAASAAYATKWGASYPSQPRSSSVIESAAVRVSEQGLAEGSCD